MRYDEFTKQSQLNEFQLNPTGAIASAIRWAVNNPVLIAAVGAAGLASASAATAGLALGPIMTLISSGQAGVGLLTLDKLMNMISSNPNQAEGYIKKYIYNYIGDESDVQEFEKLHAQTAYQGLTEFRWRAEEWPVTIDKNAAERWLEKNDRYWLDTYNKEQADKEQAATQPLGGVAEGVEQMTPNWAKYVLDQIYNSNGAVTLTDLFDEGIPGLHAMFMDTAQQHGFDPEEDFEDVQHELTVELEDLIKGGHDLEKQGVAEAGFGRATGRAAWDSNMPGYQGDYGGEANWGRREREDDEHHEIDRRMEQEREYRNTYGTWYVRVDGQVIPTPYKGKAAANAAALEFKKQPGNENKLVMLTVKEQ